MLDRWRCLRCGTTHETKVSECDECGHTVLEPRWKRTTDDAPDRLTEPEYDLPDDHWQPPDTDADPSRLVQALWVLILLLLALVVIPFIAQLARAAA